MNNASICRLVLALLAAIPVASCTTVRYIPAEATPAPVRAYREPSVELWLTTPRVVRRGTDVGVHYRTTENGYVTVARIDTDGRLRILYPRSWGSQNWVDGNRIYSVDRRNGWAFAANDLPGIGYVFAVVSSRPLELSRYAHGSDFDYVALGGDVRGDPYMAMRRFAERLLDDPGHPYAIDYAEYHVDREYDYPRYVCADCHYGERPRVRDPYGHSCAKYRIVVYDDPDYYPYRYGGRNVVYTRPRYEFKPVVAGELAKGVERRRRGSSDVDGRRPGPARDPNLPAPGHAGNAGSGGTRPGDDAPDSRDRPGRRRGHEADGPGNSNNAPGHVKKPVRDESPAPGNGQGNGNGQNNGNNGNNGTNGNNGNGQGNGNNPGNSGNAPGNSGNAPGNSGHAPGTPVTAPGNSGDASGNGGTGNNGSNGQGNGNNGQGTGNNPGNSGNAGHLGTPHTMPRHDRATNRPVTGEPRAQPPREESEPALRIPPHRESERPMVREETRREEPRQAEPRREEPRREEPRRAEPPQEKKPEPKSQPASKQGSKKPVEKARRP